MHLEKNSTTSILTVLLNPAGIRKMNKSHLTTLYLGIAILVSGCVTFVGGLVYLLWMAISEPAIIKKDISTHIVTGHH
ncbi:UNVERIFIED_ORG: hypothetical protein QE446_003828 [Rhizobium sp. SORGH_AS260]|uniref:hypothetical protein n=1 Tax=Agrobacterium sp. SORGH_AS_0440 TaxID=3041757 RepID=UPI002781D165|nr:hypothetical protein [Agrobacterium sp. SORGH_AS_0440]MDP9732215.1 hypothetical protein [Rhizobium sp. SORGH_AS_0285]MDP9755952.1 hypothetical protein [Rhizobium sp. SORGH_AS_0260]MDR6081387.1 hypothetical protein [Agrobacterium sp. SORGH_AS_0440]